MDTISIKVSDYYGTPKYYSVMPKEVFKQLESAFLNNEEYITTDKAVIEKMHHDFNLKITKL